MTSRTKPSRPTRNPGLPDIDFSNDPPLDGLEQIGDLPIYGSPVEPVEPWDCRRWPSSPLCGENPYTDTPVGFEVEISHNGCATCVTITPVLAFTRLPPLTYCYIRPECQVPLPPPPSRPGCINSNNVFDYSENLENQILDGYEPSPDDLISPCDDTPSPPLGDGRTVTIEIYKSQGSINCGTTECQTSPVTRYLYWSVTGKNDFVFKFNQGSSPSSVFFQVTGDGKEHTGWQMGSSHFPGDKVYENSEGQRLYIPQGTAGFGIAMAFFRGGLVEKRRTAAWIKSQLYIDGIEISPPEIEPPTPPNLPPSPNPPENMNCCAELRRLLKTVIIKQKELETREKVQLESLEDIRRAVGVKIFPVEVPGSYDWAENLPNAKFNSIPELIRWTTNRLGELENKIARATGAHLMPVPVPARYDAATGTVEVNNLVDLIKWTTQKLADVENRTRKAVEGLEDSVGVNDFPVKVPELLLTDRGDKEIDVKSIPDLIVWFVKQFDALVGELPGKLEIEDTDLINEGNQSKLMTFPTLSDLLLEIAGVCINNKINTEAILTTVLNTMVEAGSTKTTAVANHHAIQAILDYLSPDLAQDKVKVPLSFTPGEAKLDKLLKPKEVEVKIVKVASETDLKDDIADLKKFASEWRAQNIRRIKINGTEVAQVLGFIKDAASALGGDEDIKGGKSDFSEFVEQAETGFISENGISDTTNPYGRPYKQRPKIRELGNTSDQGTE